MGIDTIRTRAWTWYLAGVVFVAQFYVVSAFGSTPNDALYIAIGVSAMVAGIAGLVIQRPQRWFAWALIVGSIGAYLVGDAILADLQESNPFPPFPSLADWLYLGIYPVLAVAFVVVRRAIAPGRDRQATLDATIIAVAALGVLGPLYLVETWNSPFLDTQQQWVAIAYPVGDAVVLGIGARLVFAAGRRVTTLTLLGAAAASITIGNAVYNAEALGAGFEPGGVGSVGWLGFTSLLAAATLHPSTRFAGTSALDARRPLPSFARVAAVVVTVAAHLRWGDADTRVLTAACLIVIVALGAIRARSPKSNGDAEILATADIAQREAVTI